MCVCVYTQVPESLRDFVLTGKRPDRSALEAAQPDLQRALAALDLSRAAVVTVTPASVSESSVSSYSEGEDMVALPQGNGSGTPALANN